MKYEDNALAAIAGFVDTLGFVALFGLFTAHVTGNFILIGAEAAGYGQGVVMKLMAFPAFIAGVTLSSILMKTVRQDGPAGGPCLLYCVQAILLLGFCLMGVKVAPVVDVNSASVIVCGMLGAAAMGVQNAHGRLATRPGVPHTVMTGNVTQAVLDVLDLASSQVPAETKSTIRARLAKTLQAVGCFALGAIGGALGYKHFSFWALILPFAVLVWLAVVARDGQTRASRAGAAGPTA